MKITTIEHRGLTNTISIRVGGSLTGRRIISMQIESASELHDLLTESGQNWLRIHVARAFYPV